MGRTISLAAILAVALTATASADRPVYPAPTKPKVQAKPKGPFKTLKVAKRGAQYKTIAAAVKAAHEGDTIRVANGVYKEGVLAFLQQRP